MGHYVGYMHDMMGWGTWMSPWGWLIVLVVVAILIFAVAGQRGRNTAPYPNEPFRRDEQDMESSLEILKKRYAKGEISKEEFERIRRDISTF